MNIDVFNEPSFTQLELSAVDSTVVVPNVSRNEAELAVVPEDVIAALADTKFAVNE